MTIAALESAGVEVSYVTTFSPDGPGSEVVEYVRERWNAFEYEHSLAEQRRTVGGCHRREIYAGTRRKQNHSNGDFVGPAGDGVWFGAQVESPLHGFLWNER